MRLVAYDCPETNALERNVFIQAVELGNFEITQSTNVVSISIDLSPIAPPENSLFHSVNFHHERPLELKSFEIVGWPDMGMTIRLEDINITTQVVKN